MITPTVAVEMKLNGVAWTDVSDDVLPGITVKYGIQNNGPLDRVASTGSMTFRLKNNLANSAKLVGYYSPGHVRCRSGFAVGCQVRLRIEYDGQTFYKFYGRIPNNGIRLAPGRANVGVTEVTVLDWIDIAAHHKLRSTTIQPSAQTIDDVVKLIVGDTAMTGYTPPIAPLATQYATGVSEFTNVFDTVKPDTSALGEFTKVALSEWGRVYVKRDQTAGETLVVDSRSKVQDSPVPTQIPVASDLMGVLLCEDGSILTTKDGLGLLIEQDYVDAAIGGTSGVGIASLDASHGKNFYNRVTFKVNPSYVDTSLKVLFASQAPIKISSYTPITNFVGTFRDPAGGSARVSGSGMETPAATTDYQMFDNTAGTGTDRTGSLTVTAVYGPESVRYELTSALSWDTYITKLQARGYGIYYYDPVSLTTDDPTTQAISGVVELPIEMKYEKNILNAQYQSEFQLDQYKTPVTTIDKITYIANIDQYAMNTFLWMEPGDRLTITESQTGINGDYFINGVQFAIGANALVSCSYIPVSAALDGFRVSYYSDGAMPDSYYDAAYYS